MNIFRKQLEQHQANIKLLEIFEAKYDAKIPQGIHCNFSLGGIMDNIPELRFYIPDNSRRDAILTLCGDIFGRGDWTGVVGYDRDAYDWSKLVDGVRITIHKAQLLDRPQTFPVDPRSFPIQLEEKTSDVAE